MKIRIASRESRLAMWQANHVRQLLLQMPEVSDVEIVGMTTRGDQILDQTLSKIGGKGLFIKELEVALLEGRADLAVHSGKDIPMELEPAFELLGFMTREEPTDAFVSNHWNGLEDLPEGAIVGSSSLRRQAQVLALRPDLQVKPLRGNLDTRLAKLDRGEYDAIVLATAGLKRMEMTARIRSIIEPEKMLPAVGQGALGLEILAGRPDLSQLLSQLIDPVETLLVSAEREISRALGGSCQVPIAGYATKVNASQMHLKGLVAGIQGSPVLVAEHLGSLTAPIENAQVVVESLKAQGAIELVKRSVNP